MYLVSKHVNLKFQVSCIKFIICTLGYGVASLLQWQPAVLHNLLHVGQVLFWAPPPVVAVFVPSEFGGHCLRLANLRKKRNVQVRYSFHVSKVSTWL